MHENDGMPPDTGNDDTLEISREDNYGTYPCKKPRIGGKTHTRLSAVYTPEYDAWLRSFGLTPCWETHKDCHEDFIWHGYRPNPSSFTYCLKSAFYPSNETLNAWTHFIPFLFMTWRAIVAIGSLEKPFEKLTYPFWIQSLGTISVLLASAIAHLFGCHSAVGQELCFCLDYGMIPVFGLTVAISYDHYVCSFDCFGFHSDFLPRLYLIAMSMVAIIGTYLTCLSRYPSCPMRYLCRYGPFGFCFVLGGLPCFIRFLINEFHVTKLPDHCRLGENYDMVFRLHGLAFAMAVIFLATRFPERWFTGRCDIVAHSHQWFHVLTAIGMYLQHYMAESALKDAIKLRDNKLLDERSLRISVWSTFVPIFVLVCFLPLIILRTAFRVGRIIEKERKKAL